MENADLNKIRHFKGSVADFKNYFDQRAGENTNAFGTPDYQGFNDVHPTRGPKASPHWKMNEADTKGFDIFGYKTKDFDICPGAESLYKRIVDEEDLPISKGKMTDSEKEMVRQSAELQDLLYAREKRALKIGAGKSDVKAAEDLAKKIMSLAKKMGLEKEHGYIQGHVDKIKSKMINEETINEEITFQELVNKYKDNPYGIGANSIEYIESKNWGNQLVLRFKDSYDRKEAEADLKKMGIKAKNMSKSTADKGFKYRYELTVFESNVNEETDREVGHTDDEPGMIADDLRIIERYAKELKELIESEGMKGETDFPHWWQSKIVLAKEYLVKAKHYLRGELEKDSSDQAIPTFENYKHKG